jgi:hypothetical protein
VARAAGLLKLSVRQARRIWKRYRLRGDAGLVHGLRGRRSNHAIDEAVKGSALRLYRQKYPEFGPTLAAEKLAEHDGIELKPVTLWRWLLNEGLWARRRRRKKHRSRRERRSCFGEMIQMDGSHHDWFEGRGERCVLMVMVDDATGKVFARFYEGETTAACFDVFGRYVRKHGLPRALYVDRDSIYRSDRQATVEEELRAESPLTQFSRAMKELSVELILANSPQAKGRVERANGTLQDRLVKELRLAGINDIAPANKFLEKKFLPALNRKFAIEPREHVDLHRRLPRGIMLDEVLCFRERRVVSGDWCVSWRKRVLQLDRRHESLGLVKRTVTVREKLDGSIQLLHRGRRLKFKDAARSTLPPPERPQQRPVIRNNRHWTPPPDHPWVSRPAVVPRVSRASAAPTLDLHAEKKKVTVLLK